MSVSIGNGGTATPRGPDRAAGDRHGPDRTTDREAASPVDVVILSWERVDDTLAAIDSALAQQGVRVTVTVVDQGSSLPTLERLRAVAARHDNLRLRELGYNAGVAGGRNLATAEGEAEIVVALDNDAVFDGPHTLARVVERFRDRPRLAAIGFRILNAYTGELDLLCWGYPKSQLAMADRPFLTTRFVGAGHAYRRSAFERVGRYDDSLFFYWEEVDLSFRLINHGYEILYDPGLRIFHNVSPERRVSWEGERYYYMVRNRLYIEYKYRQSALLLLPMACGYLVKGLVNGVAWQAVRGAVASVSMIARLRRAGLPPRLSRVARRYIREHELVHRGSLWTRLRREVLVALPGSGKRLGRAGGVG